MAKYKVLQTFRDKDTKEVYKESHEIEMTVKRADEAIENLKGHDGEFLERIDNKQEDEQNGKEKGESETGRKEGHEVEKESKSQGKKEKEKPKEQAKK